MSYMYKSRVKTGGHHAIFWVLKVKRSKALQKLNKRVFVYIDYPSNLFAIGVFAKRWPKCARISIQNWCSPKSDRWLFLTLTVRAPFHRKFFKWKKYGGAGLISEKTEALYADLNKRAEAATSSYSVTGDFLKYIYFVLLTKNPQNIRSTCLAKFRSQIFFNDINHG